jgi:glycine cleavage system aminomethyltransferase T
MAGIDIPLQPCAHPFIRTTPLPELAGTEGIVQPLWRHQDHSMYLWQDEERYGIGSYRHEPVIVDPEQIRNDTPAPADLPFDMTPMQSGFDEAKRLVPALRNAGITDRVYGMFSFTPDGNSLLGEAAGVRGLWVAEAVWVTHGIGSGRAIAELMLTGESELDLRDLDLNRFAPHAAARSYVRARGWQQYKEVYDIIHPRDVITSPRNLRRSPFYDRQKELGTVFTESNGWERPLWFEANAALPRPQIGVDREGWGAYRWSPIASAEHIATRESAALYDFSTFTKIDVTGGDALQFLESLSCTDLDRPIGRATYALFLNPHGGIETDLTILRLDDNRFRIFAGAASGPRDLAYLRHHARKWEGITIQDVTSASVALGLWGPNAQAILDPITEGDLSPDAVRSFESKEVFIAGIPVLAIRMSYAGEDGFELHVATEYGAALWDAIWEAGAEHGLVAAGLTALDSLRIECGYRGLGTDLRADRTPIEAGLGFAISKIRDNFIGFDGLTNRAPAEKLSLLAFDDPNVIVMGKEPVLVDGKKVGYVTSSNFGYSTGKSLAFAYLPVDLASPGSRAEIEYFGVRYPVTVVEEPLIAPKRTEARRVTIAVS